MLMRNDKYDNRKYIIIAIISAIGLIFIIKIGSLQLWDDKYKYAASNNSTRNITVYPPRGLVYDRNGELIVENQPVFDLMVTPRLVKNIDTAEFCKIVDIDKRSFIERIKKAKNYSYYKPSIFISQISKEEIAFLQEKFYKYPGFFVQTRSVRTYPYKVAAHVFGYVGEVNSKIIEQKPYYKTGDYIGISGIEKTYEKALRGTKGVKKYLVDKHNKIVGRLADGKLDKAAKNGKNLYSTLDIELQAYGEKLMQQKKGAIVAIEPSTGEILSMVSSPAYDPDLLVGRKRGNNYNLLVRDTLKPLLNRALISSYPPGSTFKLINALIGLQEKVINENSKFSCRGGFSAGGLHVGCHAHRSPLGLKASVEHSCNAYYCNVFKRIVENNKYKNSEEGFKKWRKYVLNLGFGVKYGIDIPSEKTGNIPKSTYYDKFYGRHHWNYLTIISLSIGQGEILATPLQLANQAAIFANRGFYYKPHFIRAIGHPDSLNSKYLNRIETMIDKAAFEVVVEGMEDVVISGTARIAKIDSISICGKTGTVQNPHGENHSVFIAFAPKDNPKIAIATFVENSGYGSTWAAPITSLMIEKYLNKEISDKRKWLEKRMFEGNLLYVKKKEDD